jgi:hypothetical protein
LHSTPTHKSPGTWRPDPPPPAPTVSLSPATLILLFVIVTAGVAVGLVIGLRIEAGLVTQSLGGQ